MARKLLPLTLFLSSLLWAFGLAAQNADANHPPVLDVSSMDKSVDPCADFYTYACGGWMKKNPIPPDQTSWGVYSKMADETRALLREILEDAAKSGSGADPDTRKIGDYYSACMDEKAVDAAGLKPLQPAFDQIEKVGSKRQLSSLAADFSYEGVLFTFSSDQDYKDSSQVIAEIDQGGLGLPDRDYYLKEDARSRDLRKAYVAHVQKIFELLGDKPSLAATESQTVLRIETALAQASLSRVDRRTPSNIYHKMTLQQLRETAPRFDWNTYFAKNGLGSLQSLNVATPQFFAGLSAQLQKEDLDGWKAYLRWHVAHSNAPFLSAAFVNANFDFFGKTLQGAEQNEPRWKRCVSYVDDDIGEALGEAYVGKAFGPDAKQRAVKMVRQIEQAMQADIEGLDWMSPETKKRALEKLHTVANKVGYPDKWRDYSALTIDPADELGNATRARKFEFQRQLAKIGKPVDRGEWQMTPPTVNAYFDPQKNDINFPAGILQPPLFDPKADDAPNYGDTGGTIGHELTHGFDDEGRQFDAQGNLKDWWTPEDGKEFDQRAKCISDQYSQYVAVDDIKINGKLTLGEDVADLGGLLLAYMAWQQQTKDQKLDAIDGFSPEQRFFVGYGQSWCNNTRDETKRLRATVDPHSPDKFRANGVVSNMPQFQKAFQCKAGAAMVRENRCRVW